MMDTKLAELALDYKVLRTATNDARDRIYRAVEAKPSETDLEELAELLEWKLQGLRRRAGYEETPEPVLSIRERVMPLLPTDWEKAEKTYERISGLLGVAEPTIKKIVKSIAHDGGIEFKGYATKYMGREGFRQTEYRRPTDLGL